MPRDFKIRRGLSTELFDEEGNLRSTAIIELGSWYLCTDTCIVYICVRENDKLVLKIVNGTTLDNKFNEVDNTLDEIEDNITWLKNQKLYQKINSEADLPTDFEATDFNPNIVYYIVTDSQNNRVSLFIFDTITESYMCTNKIDFSDLESDILQLIDTKLTTALENKVPEMVTELVEAKVPVVAAELLETEVPDMVTEILETVVPELVTDTLETKIIFGGTANFDADN